MQCGLFDEIQAPRLAPPEAEQQRIREVIERVKRCVERQARVATASAAAHSSVQRTVGGACSRIAS